MTNQEKMNGRTPTRDDVSNESYQKAHDTITAALSKLEDGGDVFTAKELESIIVQQAASLDAKAFNDAIASASKEASYFDATNLRDWGDIALRSVIDLTIKGAVVATGVYAYSKLTNRTQEDVPAAETNSSLTEQKENVVADPFASKEFGAPARTRKGDVRSITASH